MLVSRSRRQWSNIQLAGPLSVLIGVPTILINESHSMSSGHGMSLETEQVLDWRGIECLT